MHRRGALLMFKRSKRASLEISINAIVILVMAMVVLGLGLTFVRGLFDKGGGKLTEAIDNNDLDIPASPERPLTVDSKVKVRLGKDATFRIGFYNTETAKVSLSLAGSNGGLVNCVDGAGQYSTFRLSSISTEVDAGTAVARNVLIKPVHAGDKSITTVTAAVVAGVYICPVEVSYSVSSPPLTEQIEVTVTG